MPIVFNLSGLAIGLLAAIVGLMCAQGVATLWPAREVVEWAGGLAGFALVAIPFDWRYRRQRQGEKGLFSPLTGGSLMFLPVWLIGAAAIPGAIYLVATCPESMQQVLARHEPAMTKKAAELKAGLDLVKTGKAGAAVAPLAGLDPRPFVDWPANRANTAFVLDRYSADGAASGQYSQDLLYLLSWYDPGESGPARFTMRQCAGDFGSRLDAAAGIRYLVARESAAADVFHFIDLKASRLLASFTSAPEPDALREALARLTGGTFTFR